MSNLFKPEWLAAVARISPGPGALNPNGEGADF
jgi:hypothetical protein